MPSNPLFHFVNDVFSKIKDDRFSFQKEEQLTKEKSVSYWLIHLKNEQLTLAIDGKKYKPFDIHITLFEQTKKWCKTMSPMHVSFYWKKAQKKAAFRVYFDVNSRVIVEPKMSDALVGYMTQVVLPIVSKINAAFSTYQAELEQRYERKNQKIESLWQTTDVSNIKKKLQAFIIFLEKADHFFYSNQYQAIRRLIECLAQKVNVQPIITVSDDDSHVVNRSAKVNKGNQTNQSAAKHSAKQISNNKPALPKFVLSRVVQSWKRTLGVIVQAVQVDQKILDKALALAVQLQRVGKRKNLSIHDIWHVHKMRARLKQQAGRLMSFWLDQYPGLSVITEKDSGKYMKAMLAWKKSRQPNDMLLAKQRGKGWFVYIVLPDGEVLKGLVSQQDRLGSLKIYLQTLTGDDLTSEQHSQCFAAILSDLEDIKKKRIQPKQINKVLNALLALNTKAGEQTIDAALKKQSTPEQVDRAIKLLSIYSTTKRQLPPKANLLYRAWQSDRFLLFGWLLRCGLNPDFILLDDQGGTLLCRMAIFGDSKRYMRYLLEQHACANITNALISEVGVKTWLKNNTSKREVPRATRQLAERQGISNVVCVPESSVRDKYPLELAVMHDNLPEAKLLLSATDFGCYLGHISPINHLFFDFFERYLPRQMLDESDLIRFSIFFLFEIPAHLKSGGQSTRDSAPVKLTRESQLGLFHRPHPVECGSAEKRRSLPLTVPMMAAYYGKFILLLWFLEHQFNSELTFVDSSSGGERCNIFNVVIEYVRDNPRCLPLAVPVFNALAQQVSSVSLFFSGLSRLFSKLNSSQSGIFCSRVELAKTQVAGIFQQAEDDAKVEVERWHQSLLDLQKDVKKMISKEGRGSNNQLLLKIIDALCVPFFQGNRAWQLGGNFYPVQKSELLPFIRCGSSAGRQGTVLSVELVALYCLLLPDKNGVQKRAANSKTIIPSKTMDGMEKYYKERRLEQDSREQSSFRR
jgi:hypothetical protein